MLLPFAVVLSTFSACTSDDDCSLNGICDTTSGRCDCDAEWSGVGCGVLNLLPTSRAAGFKPTNQSSWGGSIIRGDDGKLHMFAALMTEHCGLTSWATNSEVVHTVADTPTAPFRLLNVSSDGRAVPVLRRFAHNPTIHRNRDGRYLLYHIGCSATAEPCVNCARCTNGTTCTTCGGNAKHGSGCNGPHWTGLHSSESLYGPWRDEGEVTLSTPKANKWITNPCVVPAGKGNSNSSTGANATFLLYRQSSGSWPASSGGGERLGWAVSMQCPSAINCTYVDESATAPLLDVNLEDQYLWISHRGHFHALTHKNAAGAVSGHMWSRDGHNWRMSTIPPYNNTLFFSDGSTYECRKRARPMLIVENMVSSRLP